jgi:hypothetical protein
MPPRKSGLVRDNQSMLQQLEQSTQWQRLLVSTSPDVIYTLDADRLAIAYVLSAQLTDPVFQLRYFMP